MVGELVKEKKVAELMNYTSRPYLFPKTTLTSVGVGTMSVRL